MEKTYQYLKELLVTNTESTIKVRIIRQWEARHPVTNHLLNKNYILIDEQGTLFHVPLMLNQIEDYTKRLQIGNVYMISNFAVVAAKQTYRPVTGDHVINFSRKTIVTKLNHESTIPIYGFKLTSFTEAKSRLGDIKTLIDIAGVLHTISTIESVAQNKEKLDIVLQDKKGDVITVTLWGAQAREFQDMNAQYQKPNTVIIITGTKASMFRGEISLSSTSATQYFINVDCPELQDLHANGVHNIAPIIVPNIHNSTQLPTDIENLTIENLFDVQLKDGTENYVCSIDATVTAIIPNFGWYYIACDKCNRKMTTLASNCNKCPNQNTVPVYKYKVTVQVEDSTSTTTLLLFDRYVMDLVKVPVQHVLDNDEAAHQYKTPSILGNIIGRRYNFLLKLTQYNTVEKREDYTVIKVQDIKETGNNKKDLHDNFQSEDEKFTNAYDGDKTPRKEDKAFNKRKMKNMSSEISKKDTKKTKKSSRINSKHITDTGIQATNTIDETLLDDDISIADYLQAEVTKRKKRTCVKRKNIYASSDEENKE